MLDHLLYHLFGDNFKPFKDLKFGHIIFFVIHMNALMHVNLLNQTGIGQMQDQTKAGNWGRTEGIRVLNSGESITRPLRIVSKNLLANNMIYTSFPIRHSSVK